MALRTLIVAGLAASLAQAQNASNSTGFDPLQYVDQLIGASNGGRNDG